VAGTSGDPPVRLSTNLAVRRLVNRIAPDPVGLEKTNVVVTC
jgi:hypothetical protein